MNDRTPIRIGIAGLGTVGTALCRDLLYDSKMLAARAGRPLRLGAVTARDKTIDRGVDLSGVEWAQSPMELARRDDVDIVIELIGGEGDPAYSAIMAALEEGKPVITANKALMARHGYTLACHAEKKGVTIGYEAAVAAAIPAVKTLRESLAGRYVHSVHGILNGTSNYILTGMANHGCDFDTMLRDAQDKGYAEADPAADVDGNDAAQKLALLTASAFGVCPDIDSVQMRGIRDVNLQDIAYANSLGYTIKLIAVAKQEQDGSVHQLVEPCLVQDSAPLAGVNDVINAVRYDADALGHIVMSGYGAGGGATASAVLSDLVDVAAGNYRYVFGIPAEQLSSMNRHVRSRQYGRFYLRLTALDKPGVLAAIADKCRDHDLSIESFLQRGRDPGQPVNLVILTHECSRGALYNVLDDIESLHDITERSHTMRIIKT